MLAGAAGDIVVPDLDRVDLAGLKEGSLATRNP
jgi:hypothetical protein